MTNNKVKKIEVAPLFNRTFGAIIDFVLTLLVGLGIFLGLSNIMMNTKWVKSFKEDYNSVIVNSGIMKYDSKNQVVPYVLDTYEEYEEKFYSFYKDYLPTLRDNTQEIDKYWYNVFIYGQDDILNRYSDKELSNRYELVLAIGKSYFGYRKDGEGNPITSEFALPIQYENDPANKDNITKLVKKKLVSYYYVSDSEIENDPIAKEYKYIYFYSLSELTSLPRPTKDYQNFALYGTTLPLALGLTLGILIFFFIIPMCFKNGETIGKLVMHTCLVNKLGYQYRRIQLVPRFIFMALSVLLIIYFVGINLITVGILSALLLASFITMILTKDHKAIHDFIAGTLVIDKRNSTWFKDINEEERYQKQVDDYEERHKKELAVEDRTNIIYSNPHSNDNKTPQ